MKTNYDKTLDKLINILFENVDLMFRETDRFQQLIENHDKKLNAYESVLSDCEKILINEYLTALNELTAAELEFVCIQGYKDCVFILKKIGVL